MVLQKPIRRADFAHCVHKNFGEYMVKLVVDLEKEIIAYDAEWHADLEAELLATGSINKDLWGFNYYPDNDILEYNSLINIRPMINKSSDIMDADICADVERVFRKWLCDE